MKINVVYGDCSILINTVALNEINISKKKKPRDYFVKIMRLKDK